MSYPGQQHNAYDQSYQGYRSPVPQYPQTQQTFISPPEPEHFRTPSPYNQPPRYPETYVSPSPQYPPSSPRAQQQSYVYNQPPVNNPSYQSLPYPSTPPPVTPVVRAESVHYRDVPPTSYHRPPHTPPGPPQQAQAFDPRMGNSYQFQYSQCNNNRKALLIGINYFGTSNALKGCINDVRNIAPFLNQRYNFAYDDMVILTDDQQNPAFRPTRANIIKAMQWLVKDAKPNDSLFFHFSGHGGQTEDLDGDEDDGLDETIYPVDFKQAGMIVDDEMHDIMVKPLPAGCRLTAIFDCCHSGSLLDLPYEYGSSGLLKEPNTVHETGKGLLAAAQHYARGDVDGLVSVGVSLFNRLTRSKEQREQTRIRKTSPADVIQFSGCKDDQKAADSVEGGETTGAMSWAFKQILTAQPKQSYASLLANIREILAAKYSQKPVLSASHPIDTKLLFVL